MDVLLNALAIALIVAGLLGALVPVLPGIPLIVGGIWMITAVDQYRHVGRWWLLPKGRVGRLSGYAGRAVFGLPGLLLGLVGNRGP